MTAANVLGLLFLAAAAHAADAGDDDNKSDEDLAVALTTLAYSFFVIGVGLYFTCTNPAFHTLKLKSARKHKASKLLDFSQLYAPTPASTRNEFKNSVY